MAEDDKPQETTEDTTPSITDGDWDRRLILDLADTTQQDDEESSVTVNFTLLDSAGPEAYSDESEMMTNINQILNIAYMRFNAMLGEAGDDDAVRYSLAEVFSALNNAVKEARGAKASEALFKDIRTDLNHLMQNHI